ncbi:MAG: family 1 glycosylhydrolase, partial [Clostridiales bacterium]|nr:family 1 glycosylhydrolase [Clostridiales bacterium]
MKVKDGFIFGAATSSYQIEGGRSAGNRADCIWDDFCDSKKVANGHNADIACDHYNRYEEDIDLLLNLGVSHYRMSVAWGRIFPAPGKFNREGMDFYVRLLTALKAKNIKACVTLYHWDMPKWLQDMGGWEVRDNIGHFLQYAEACFKYLDPLADMWITHNEPWCASILSNYLGRHAPAKTDLSAALKVGHNILLSHGMTVKLYREKSGFKKIGITVNLNPVHPKTESASDRLAAANFDGNFNRWFLDALFKGAYPSDMTAFYKGLIGDFSFVRDGDFGIIGEPCDFLGINYYQCSMAEYDADAELLFREVWGAW